MTKYFVGTAYNSSKIFHRHSLFLKSGNKFVMVATAVERHKDQVGKFFHLSPGSMGHNLTTPQSDELIFIRKMLVAGTYPEELVKKSRYFSEGFHYVDRVFENKESDLIGEIFFVGRDSNLSKDVLSLNGEIIPTLSIKTKKLDEEIPFALGNLYSPTWSENLLGEIKSIKYHHGTSSVRVAMSVDGRLRTWSLENFKKHVADNNISNKSIKTEKGKIVMKTSAMQKMMDRMFKKVTGVVLDAMTGGVGVRRGDSVYSLSSEEVDGKTEYSVGENLFEQLSFDVPAFAQATPLSKVKVTDLVLNASGAPHGWVIKVNDKSMKVLKMDGTVATTVPSKVLMMGAGQTVMVVSSLATGQMSNMLPLLMLMEEKGGKGSDSLDKLLPLMMMSNNGDMSGMDSMMSNPMMLMALMGDDDTFSDPMMMMAMSGMFGQPQQEAQQGGMFGGMNPMMAMMLLKK